MKPEDSLGKVVKIRIDYPMGSKDSEHGFMYPINYGYVSGVADKELRAYLLGVFEPVEEYEGRLIGIIYREDDTDETLVVAPRTYTDEQITALIEFRERWYVSWLAHIYDKHCWPDEFSIDASEVQKAIKAIIKNGEFSLTEIVPIMKMGYGRCTAFGFWLADNGIIEDINKAKLKKISTIRAKLKVKTYAEAIEKLNS